MRGSAREDGHHSSQSSRPQTEDERDSASVSRRSRQSSRRREQAASGQSQSSYQQQNGNNNFVGGFAPTIAEHPTSEESSDTQPSQASEQPGPHRRSDIAFTETSSSSRTSTPPPQVAREYSPSSSNYEIPIAQEPDNRQLAPSPPPPVPASVKRYSLVDKPAASLTPPTVIVEPSSPMQDWPGATSPSPPPDTPPTDPSPAVAISLAALKSNEVMLERRASKRFSVYNISKMTGGSTSRERSLRGHPNLNRRSVAAASLANLTPNDLAVLTEDDEEAESPKEPASSGKRQSSISRSVVRNNELPPVPGLPTTPEPTLDAKDSSSDQHQSPSDSQTTVFLQLGREVKKVKVEPGLTFSSLRVLFVDKFSYNPGLENFPAIYIRDPSSGVQYELENTDEVQENCLLSLNIERGYSFLLIEELIRFLVSFCSSRSNQATY